jgi:hypothetical protein
MWPAGARCGLHDAAQSVLVLVRTGGEAGADGGASGDGVLCLGTGGSARADERKAVGVWPMAWLCGMVSLIFLVFSSPLPSTDMYLLARCILDSVRYTRS